MSNPNELKRLENDLKNDPELQKKLDEACKRIAAEGKAQSDAEVTAAAAKELGYDISLAVLEQAKAELEKLDVEALSQVSGGTDRTDWCWRDHACILNYETGPSDKDGHDFTCIATWHCLMAMLHTEGGTQDEECWSDWRCSMINKFKNA